MTTRRLQCVLNDSDIFDRGHWLANAEHEYVKMEDDKKAANEQFKRDLSAIDARIGVLTHAIRNKVEMREVECTTQQNTAKLVHEVVRMDTGAIIETYPFSDAERNRSLFQD